MSGLQQSGYFLSYFQVVVAACLPLFARVVVVVVATCFPVVIGLAVARVVVVVVATCFPVVIGLAVVDS
jgi:hypothetical protein